MTLAPFRFVFCGLSITSSWGNGHATTYRSLIRALAARGHDVTFLERNLPWYAENRDLPHPPYARTHLYDRIDDLKRFTAAIEEADLVVVGSYTPEGIAVGRFVLEHARGVTAFYDIDTPVTLAALRRGTCDYISPEQVEKYALYLSFTGGPTLRRLETEFGSPMARPLYCSVDPDLYKRSEESIVWDVGYLGTYSRDRQAALESRLLQPARRCLHRRFVVAGPQFPDSIGWPANVDRIVHLPPAAHPSFYSSQRFTLNLTRSAMVRAGYSPSVRLFEAAACATPIITDEWDGLSEFFEPGEEILISTSSEDTLRYVNDLPADVVVQVGARGRARVLRGHTSEHRALELESYVAELRRQRVA